MNGTLEFFKMSDRQKQAWVAIMGNGNFPGSRQALLEAVTPMWANITEHDKDRMVVLMEDAMALGLYEGKDDGKTLSKASRYVLRPKSTVRVAANDGADGSTEPQ